MDKLKAWLRLWRLSWRGECMEAGCEEPKARFPVFECCPKHEREAWGRFDEEREKAEFDRKAEIVAEGIRLSRTEQC